MPSSYTSSLRLTLPATGELTGTWGTTVNDGITTLLDNAVAGAATITMTAADYTLTTSNGATDEARAKILILTGTPGAARNVICPAVSKTYIVYNNTTGGFAQTIKTSAGTGISVPNGKTKIVRCDGTNVVEGFDAAGDLTLGGALSVGGAVTLTSNPTLSAGTANGVLYLDGSKVATSGSALTFNGSVLGVNNAGDSDFKLTTNNTGSGSTDGLLLRINSTGSEAYLWNWESGSSLIFGASGSEQMRLDASGNLGIGTSSPGAKLDVNGDITQPWAVSMDRFIGSKFSTTYELGLHFVEASRETRIVSKSADSADKISFYTGVTPTERMRLDTSGNLGIGTSSPARPLHVASSSTSYLARFQNSGSALALINFKDNTTGDFNVGVGANGENFVAYTSNTERMRLDSSGNLGIGTSSPAFKLDVEGSQRIRKTGAGYNADMLSFSTITETGAIYRLGMATGAAFTIGRSDVPRTDLTLDVSGNLGIGTSSPGSYGKLAVQTDGSATTAIAGYSPSTTNGAKLRLFDNYSSAGIEGVPVAATASTDLSFVAGGASLMRLDASGNLGLGVTPSAWGTLRGLQVGNASLAGFQNFAYLNSNAFYDGSAWKYIATGFAAKYDQVNSAHAWYTAPSGTAGNTISFTQAMTLDASGNLGVGTTSPSHRIDADGNIRSNAWLGRANASAPTADCAVFRPADNTLGFSTANTERARIDSAGNLGLGVTPSANSYGSTKTFFISGDSAAGLLALCEESISASSQYVSLMNNAYPDGPGIYKYKISSQQATSYRQNDGEHRWFTAPSGTAGNAISFTQAMTLDASGNLGIGTSSPAYKAHISYSQANVLGVFRDVDVSISGAAGAYIELGARNGASVTASARIVGVLNNPATSGWMTFETLSGGTIAERMRLDSSGNLGLGVTPSAWNASFKALEVANFSFFSGTGGLSSYMDNNAYFNASNQYIYKNNGHAGEYAMLTSDGSHRWYTAPSGTAGNAISFTQAMTLDASGNLGVGTTSPDSKIDAVGTGRVAEFGSETAQNSYIGFKYNTTLLGYVGNGAGVAAGSAATDFSIGSTGARALTFGTNDAERARITSGGELYVGSTSTVGSATDRLQVDAPSAARAGVFRNPSASVDTIAAWNSDTSSDNKFIQFYTEGGATVRGLIDYNRAGGLVRYNTTSDYRAKDIIGPVQNPGATIDALKVYEGVMKGATQSRPMLIAHEAQAHAPYAVSGVKDEVNEDGTPKFQQMDVSSLVPLLLAELQSLRARVAALEAA